ncbi:hypothetical protein [Dyella koreensis]
MNQEARPVPVDLQQFRVEHYDACSVCLRNFVEHETINLGYLGDGSPASTCESCSHVLSDSVAKMVFFRRPYVVPNEAVRLWRYLDFTKYVSMLATQSLYFARADQFEDPYEGAKGLRNAKSRWDEHYLRFFRTALGSHPNGVESKLTDDEIDAEAQRLLSDLELGGEHGRRQTFINCWHENERESEAMWRLYSTYLPNALAVRTSYGRLYRSLGRNPAISIGRVEYLDFESQYAGPNDAFWRKRKSFEHEREVRAMTVDYGVDRKGLHLPCDLTVLIESVVLSPTAAPWFAHVVTDVSSKYGVSVSISHSNLNDPVFF